MLPTSPSRSRNVSNSQHPDTPTTPFVIRPINLTTLYKMVVFEGVGWRGSVWGCVVVAGGWVGVWLVVVFEGGCWCLACGVLVAAVVGPWSGIGQDGRAGTVGLGNPGHRETIS